MRYFNTEGLCIPNEHYMVQLDDRLTSIKKLYIDQRKYFVINRGRQYGKTTTLRALSEYLKDNYAVWNLDFQMMSAADFEDEQTFVNAFMQCIEDLAFSEMEFTKVIDTETFEAFVCLRKQEKISMKEMFSCLSKICKTAKKPIVLMIDEVDNASNNQVFIDFLAQLRGYYLNRQKRPTFHSVILAGVYDIKNLKLKMRSDEEHQYNSPWNIAADFKVSMSFSAKQIELMLKEYETDHQVGMDTAIVAEEIYQYTSGYPYLVSAICKYLDEEVPDKAGFENVTNVWTKKGVIEAIKILLNKNIPLFGSMMSHISEYPNLKELLHVMLFQGEQIAYNPDNKTIDLARMFGYVFNDGGSVRLANRIFEMRLYNFFLSEAEVKSTMGRMAKQDRNQFISRNKLNMEWVLEKFVEYFTDIYGDNDEKFIEAHGRKFFLLYLKPIINGTGNYYIEAQTRDARRTDVIVDYAGEQFIVEMKIWHGDEYNKRGERQLAEYLDYYHQKKGYMLSFNFNKRKEIGIKTIMVDNKTIVEAVV